MIFVNVHNFGFMDPNEYLNLNFEYFAGILYLWVIQIILSKFWHIIYVAGAIIIFGI